MKRNYTLNFLSIVCVVFFILTSCNVGIDLSSIDDPSIKIDESLIVPIGEANLTVKNILSKTGLPSNIDSAANEIFFKWNISQDIDFKSFNLVDSIKDFGKTIILGDYVPDLMGVPIAAGTQIPNIPVDDFLDLGLNNTSDQRVNTIKVNSSIIDIDFNVSDDLKSQGILASDFRIDFEFPNNKVIIEDGTKPTYVPLGYNQIGHMPIGKYIMYVDGLKTLPYRINIHLKPQNSSIILKSDLSKIFLTMKFSNIDFSVAYGLFDLHENDQRLVDMPFKIEDYLPDANLKFVNPTVQIKTTSKIGVDLDVKIDYINAINSSNPSHVIWAWFGNPPTNEKNEFISGPLIFGDSIVQKFAPYDSINGQTDHLFDSKPYPNKLNYKYSIKSNPTTRKVEDFVSPDSKVKFDLNIQLPLKVKGGSSFAFTDTISNLNVGTILDNVDSAILVLKVKNGLPVRAFYRMTFWKTAADSIPAIGGIITKVSDTSTFGNMTSEYKLNSPLVNIEGDMTQMVPQSINIKLNKTQIDALKQTSFIVMHVSLDSESQLKNGVLTPNPVHITTNNNFGVKIGAFIKGNYKTNIGTSK